MILDILNELSANPSRLAKEAILQKNKDDYVLQRVVKAALDPTINYWIKKIPAYSCEDRLYTLGQAVSMLEEIASRKLTGNAAIEHLEHILSSVASQDAEVITRIIERDLKCGVQDSTANKIWKGIIPEFSYMRCALPKAVKLSKWDWKGGIYSQEKADAMFANLDVYDDGEVVISSRSGTTIPNEKLNNIVLAARDMITSGTRTHGELMVEENGKVLPREIGNGIMNSIAKGGDFKNKNQRAVYVVWDQIPLGNAQHGTDYETPYSTRFVHLQAQVQNLGVQDSIRVIPFKMVYSYEDALQHYQEMLEEGKEGTIIKTKTGIWKDSTSKDQVKFKLEATVDLEIISLNEGKGKNEATFGSILCRTSDGLLEVNVSGFSDDDRVAIADDWDNICGKIMAVTGNSLMKPTGKKVTWSMFLPRCAEIREDKHVADSLKQVIDQFDSLIK
jgi:DNA ligase-1